MLWVFYIVFQAILREHARLANISHLKSVLPNVVIGYSDHTQSILTPSVAVGMGARIIEKHLSNI